MKVSENYIGQDNPYTTYKKVLEVNFVMRSSQNVVLKPLFKDRKYKKEVALCGNSCWAY
jgi:hypothetical protein